MVRPSTTGYPPTLVFHSVDGFLAAVQARDIHEIGCATLQRKSLFAQNMIERRLTYMQLTARDHARNEILTCSVYLKEGDFTARDELFMPADEWRRQIQRAERIQQALHERLARMPELQILDAAYAIHPDLALRFAAFPAGDPDDQIGQI